MFDGKITKQREAQFIVTSFVLVFEEVFSLNLERNERDNWRE